MNASRDYQPLCDRRQFRRVYEEGQRFHAPHFSVFILRTGDGGSRRIGLTVTRKIGNAVVRNRCKRRLREVVRAYYRAATLPTSGLAGYDVVVNVKAGLVGAAFQELQDAFGRVMNRFHDSLRAAGGGKEAS
jgi:ribonuclease P protein component